jgi:hypothetical protein
MLITRLLLLVTLALTLPGITSAQSTYNNWANRAERENQKRAEDREKMAERKEERKKLGAIREIEQKLNEAYYGPEKYGFKVYRPSNSSKWGVVDKYNKTVIPAIYDHQVSFDNFINGIGIARVSLNGKYGFINSKNEIVVPIIYTETDVSLTDFTRVSTGGKLYGYIDTKNKTVVTIKYKSLSRFNASGYAVANEKMDADKFGSIDKAGIVVIPFVYEDIIWDGEFAIIKKNGKWGVLNDRGQTLISPIYDSQISWNNQGIAYVSKSNKYGAIDKTGKTIIPFNYCDLGQVNEDVIFCQDGKWGIMDLNQNFTIKPEYDDFFYFKDGYACVKQNGNYGLLIKNTATKFYPLSNKPIIFENGMASIIWDGKYGLVNDKGIIIAKAAFDKPVTFDKVTTAVTIVLNGKYGVLNKAGDIVAKPIYDNPIIFNPQTGVADIVVDGRYGCIYQTGYVIIPPIYEKPDISYFAINRNFAVVKLNGKYGYYNIEGKAITEIKFDLAYDFSNSNFGLVRLKQKNGLVDADGNLMVLEKRLDFNEKYIEFWNGNYCPVRGQNGKHGVIDKKGNLVVDFKYQEEVFFGNGLAAVSDRKRNTFEKGLWGFIDEKGDLVIDYQFDDVGGHFANGRCQVTLAKETFYIDKTGRRVR